MKKLFCLLCFVTVSVSLVAQSNSSGEQKKEEDDQKKKKIAHMFAPFAGFTLADLRGAKESGHQSITGAEAGVSIQLLNLSDAVDLRTELLYSQQGNKTSYGEASYYSSKTETRLGYLNLPVMAHYHHKSGFFAEAGLQPGLLLSAKQKRSSSGMGGSGTTKTDIKKDLNSFDLGLPVGAGYVFKKKVAVSARVAPGLLNIVKNKDAEKLTNFVLSAKVSYIL